MVRIAPIKMVMTGGCFMIVLPTWTMIQMDFPMNEAISSSWLPICHGQWGFPRVGQWGFSSFPGHDASIDSLETSLGWASQKRPASSTARQAPCWSCKEANLSWLAVLSENWRTFFIGRIISHRTTRGIFHGKSDYQKVRILQCGWAIFSSLVMLLLVCWSNLHGLISSNLVGEWASFSSQIRTLYCEWRLMYISNAEIYFCLMMIYCLSETIHLTVDSMNWLFQLLLAHEIFHGNKLSFPLFCNHTCLFLFSVYFKPWFSIQILKESGDWRTHQTHTFACNVNPGWKKKPWLMKIYIYFFTIFHTFSLGNPGAFNGGDPQFSSTRFFFFHPRGCHWQSMILPSSSGHRMGVDITNSWMGCLSNLFYGGAVDPVFENGILILW